MEADYNYFLLERHFFVPDAGLLRTAWYALVVVTISECAAIAVSFFSPYNMVVGYDGLLSTVLALVQLPS
jgi:hypothetical protein